jgi:biopolymer transport protein ExbD
MKLRHAREFRHGRIEIIPMIDVMFFLLVTFMLASLSMQSLNSVKVNLPQGSAENFVKQEPTTLTITSDGKVFVDQAPVAVNEIAAHLKPILAARNSHEVAVAADKGALEGIVVEAMLAARQAGAEHFLIAVHHE